jgi:hypothetical protein
MRNNQPKANQMQIKKGRKPHTINLTFDDDKQRDLVLCIFNATPISDTLDKLDPRLKDAWKQVSDLNVDLLNATTHKLVEAMKETPHLLSWKYDTSES